MEPLRPRIKFLIEATRIASGKGAYMDTTVETMATKQIKAMDARQQELANHSYSDVYNCNIDDPGRRDKRYNNACEVWTKGSREECLSILGDPFKHNIIGFAYLGAETETQELEPRVHTLFFPKLHRMTKRTTHGKPEEKCIVVGNKTPYASLKETIVIDVQDLLRMLILPVRDEKPNWESFTSIQESFTTVQDWHDGKFYKSFPIAWRQAPIADYIDNPETVKTKYFPASIPLVVGYNWHEYPVLIQPPLNWAKILAIRKQDKAYERARRFRKSYKIKELKAADNAKYGHLTMEDDLSFDFNETHGDADYESEPCAEEKNYVSAKWNTTDSETICNTDTFKIWVNILQNLNHHIYLETDWTITKKPEWSEDIIWENHMELQQSLTFPMTTYAFMHTLIAQDKNLKIITTTKDRAVCVTKMTIPHTTIPEIQDRHHSLRTFWTNVELAASKDLTLFLDPTTTLATGLRATQLQLPNKVPTESELKAASSTNADPLEASHSAGPTTTLVVPSMISTTTQQDNVLNAPTNTAPNEQHRSKKRSATNHQRNQHNAPVTNDTSGNTTQSANPTVPNHAVGRITNDNATSTMENNTQEAQVHVQPTCTLWNQEPEQEEDDEQTTEVKQGFTQQFYMSSKKRRVHQSQKQSFHNEINEDLFSQSQATYATPSQSERSRCDVFYTIIGLRIANLKKGRKALAVTKPSQNFLALLASPTTGKAELYDEHIRYNISIFQNSEIWWHKMIRIWPSNGAFITALLSGRYKQTAFDKERQTLKSQINLLHFLPPPDAQNAAYSAWMNERTTNMSQYYVQGDAATSGRQYTSKALQTEIFTGGQQNKLSDFHTALANFLCNLYYIYDMDESSRPPLIVKYCMNLLSLSNKTAFTDWYKEVIDYMPWIPHQLLCLTQNVISGFVTLAKNMELQTAYLHGELTNYTPEIFNDVKAKYEHVCCVINSVGEMGTGEHFWNSAPISYLILTGKPAPTRNAFQTVTQHPGQLANNAFVQNNPGGPAQPTNYVQSRGQNKRKKDYSTMGWLKSTTVINTWPRGLTRICPGWSFVNSTCKRGRNCSKQHAYYCQLSQQEKNAAQEFVASHPGLEFNEDQTTGGTLAVPHRFGKN